MEKKISVLMGIYNCADTLTKAIDSILAQTYTNWELILCDDGSSNDTYAVAQLPEGCYPNAKQTSAPKLERGRPLCDCKTVP